VKRGNTEVADTAGGGRSRHLHGTVAVGIGLDDQQKITVGADVTLQEIQIRVEAIEIDLDPGGERQRSSLRGPDPTRRF
jgi:hypothetical protein